MIIQLTGLSGAGKTTLATKIRSGLEAAQVTVAIVDGDVYRKTICKDLGFSQADRQENIRRLGAAAAELAKNHDVVIIAAISPFEAVREELKKKYGAVVVWIKCPVDVLTIRDTKGLYKKALLPEGHPDKLYNLTGVNDIYEEPSAPELVIDTSIESIETAATKLEDFISKLRD